MSDTETTPCSVHQVRIVPGTKYVDRSSNLTTTLPKETYNRKISHNPFRSTKHIANIRTILHEAHALAPSHVAKKIPCKKGYPIRNVAGFVFVRPFHEASLELGTECSQVVVHDVFYLECVLEAV